MKYALVNRIALRSSNVHYQFMVAVALLSVIPLLGFRLFQSYTSFFPKCDASILTGAMGVLLAATLAGYSGYLILRKNDICITRLRRFFEKTAYGKRGDTLRLGATALDFTVIENCLNVILNRVEGENQSLRSRAQHLDEAVNTYRCILKGIATTAELAMLELPVDSVAMRKFREIKSAAQRGNEMVEKLLKRSGSLPERSGVVS